MRQFQSENLCHDPVHGYIPFTSGKGLSSGEVSERDIIDHPWLQRLRQIHQLQTAWWVFPTAEHTRFQHVIGVMHLASRAVEALYPSLSEICPEVPSRGYVETLMRMAGLLHDVGHGPFGHFFDEHFLVDYDLTHEILGGKIICHELGDLLRHMRRNPNSQLKDDEELDPEQIAWLITRPRKKETARPRWLQFLRSLLSGIYTIDNMDFVLRDAFMSGYSPRAFDLDRLLHYSFFSERGLTISDRGIDSLVRFMSVRAELFRTIYFHRTVRALDLTLSDLFAESKQYLFPGNPAELLSDYQRFTEWSLLVDVRRWSRDAETPQQREIGLRWERFLARQVPWQMVCQRNLTFSREDSEQSSIFSDARLAELKIRAALPKQLKELPMRVDIPRHEIYRPPAKHQNYLYDSAREQVKELTDDQLFRRLPGSQRICRVYAKSVEHGGAITAALDGLLGAGGQDDLTNM